VTAGPAQGDLVAVLKDARGLLARPGNDFLWSDWDDAPEALAEIDGLVAALETTGSEAGACRAAAVLFAPTGPLQEVALASGWPDAFAALARRLDRATGRR